MENENRQISSLSIPEQEVHITFARDQKHAMIYTSDSTYITKLNKLCKDYSDMYSLVSSTDWGNNYRLEDKTLISFRGKKRELTDEQRIAAGERMRKMRSNN